MHLATDPSVGRRNEYQPKGSDVLRLGRKGRYGSCVGGPLANTGHIRALKSTLLYFFTLQNHLCDRQFQLRTMQRQKPVQEHVVSARLVERVHRGTTRKCHHPR